MSINAIDVIDQLPLDLAAALQADDFFSDVPVIIAEKGNVKRTLSEKQAVLTDRGGRRGVAVVVLQAMADDPYPDLAFGPLKLRPAFQVVENVELNNDDRGTGKSARKVSRRIRDVIKPLRLAGLVTEFVPDEPCIIPVNLAEEPKTTIAYQVNFTCYESDTEEISQVVKPVVAIFPASTPQIQITCETEGALIYYTIDDSFPAPPDKVSGSTAVIYSSPIVIPVEGFRIRAAAWKSGMIASQVERAWVNFDETLTP
jgi:hypothetical protein